MEMNAAETVYDEIGANKKEEFDLDENKCYGEIVPKPGKVVRNDGKNHLHKVVLSLLLLGVLALLLGVVSACVALGLEIAKLKSETDSFSQQLGGDRSGFHNQIQQLNSSIQLFSQQLGEDRSEFRNQIQQLNSSMQLFFQQLGEDSSEFRNQIQQLNLSTELLVNDYIERFTGHSMLNPAASCAALPPSSPSGYYWVRASNGSPVRVYCDMTRSCGNITGGWVRVAKLDMTNSSHQCPSGLKQRTDSNIRTCVKIEDQAGCSSPSNFIIDHNIQYSMVCGRIIAYQYASTNAFEGDTYNRSAYVDGVSLTHGDPRHHIWTFAAAIGQAPSLCPCLDGDLSTGTQPPLFVGNDYFCDTGSREGYTSRLYVEDPLWDGAGCGPQSTCCSFNNPPWFYKQLPRPTTDGIEMRVCRDQNAINEDVAIAIVDVYIQ